MGVVRTGRVVVRAECDEVRTGRVVVRTGRVVVRADHGGWVAPKAVDIATTWANHTHRCSAARLPALRAAGVACCGHCVAVGIAWLRALRGCGHCVAAGIVRRCGAASLWALRGCGHCVAVGTAWLRALRRCGHCVAAGIVRRCGAASLRHCVAAGTASLLRAKCTGTVARASGRCQLHCGRWRHSTPIVWVPGRAGPHSFPAAQSDFRNALGG